MTQANNTKNLDPNYLDTLASAIIKNQYNNPLDDLIQLNINALLIEQKKYLLSLMLNKASSQAAKSRLLMCLLNTVTEYEDKIEIIRSVLAKNSESLPDLCLPNEIIFPVLQQLLDTATPYKDKIEIIGCILARSNGSLPSLHSSNEITFPILKQLLDAATQDADKIEIIRHVLIKSKDSEIIFSDNETENKELIDLVIKGMDTKKYPFAANSLVNLEEYESGIIAMLDKPSLAKIFLEQFLDTTTEYKDRINIIRSILIKSSDKPRDLKSNNDKIFCLLGKTMIDLINSSKWYSCSEKLVALIANGIDNKYPFVGDLVSLEKYKNSIITMFALLDINQQDGNCVSHVVNFLLEASKIDYDFTIEARNKIWGQLSHAKKADFILRLIWRGDGDALRMFVSGPEQLLKTFEYDKLSAKKFLLEAIDNGKDKVFPDLLEYICSKNISSLRATPNEHKEYFLRYAEQNPGILDDLLASNNKSMPEDANYLYKLIAKHKRKSIMLASFLMTLTVIGGLALIAAGVGLFPLLTKLVSSIPSLTDSFLIWATKGVRIIPFILGLSTIPVAAVAIALLVLDVAIHIAPFIAIATGVAAGAALLVKGVMSMIKRLKSLVVNQPVPVKVVNQKPSTETQILSKLKALDKKNNQSKLSIMLAPGSKNENHIKQPELEPNQPMMPIMPPDFEHENHVKQSEGGVIKEAGKNNQLF